MFGWRIAREPASLKIAVMDFMSRYFAGVGAGITSASVTLPLLVVPAREDEPQRPFPASGCQSTGCYYLLYPGSVLCAFCGPSSWLIPQNATSSSRRDPLATGHTSLYQRRRTASEAGGKRLAFRVGQQGSPAGKQGPGMRIPLGMNIVA